MRAWLRSERSCASVAPAPRSSRFGRAHPGAPSAAQVHQARIRSASAWRACPAIATTSTPATSTGGSLTPLAIVRPRPGVEHLLDHQAAQRRPGRRRPTPSVTARCNTWRRITWLKAFIVPSGCSRLEARITPARLQAMAEVHDDQRQRRQRQVAELREEAGAGGAGR